MSRTFAAYFSALSAALFRDCSCFSMAWAPERFLVQLAVSVERRLSLARHQLDTRLLTAGCLLADEREDRRDRSENAVQQLHVSLGLGIRCFLPPALSLPQLLCPLLQIDRVRHQCEPTTVSSAVLPSRDARTRCRTAQRG